MLVVLVALASKFVILDRRWVVIVRDDEVCRRLMMILGARRGATDRATVDVLVGLRNPRSSGAIRNDALGVSSWGDLIEAAGDPAAEDDMMRVMLDEAAQSMLWSKSGPGSRPWPMQIARRRGMKKAIVAGTPAGCDHGSHLGPWH